MAKIQMNKPTLAGKPRREMLTKRATIAVWGQQLLSDWGYIYQQIELAEEENAPDNAVYRNEDGKWVTLDQCGQATQSAVLHGVEQFIERLRW